jgi:hypothetical protein
MLPLVTGAVEYLSGRPCPHGTVLGLIPPTLVSSLLFAPCFVHLSSDNFYLLQAFVTVKGFGMPWPWKENLTPFEKKLNNQ